MVYFHQKVVVFLRWNHKRAKKCHFCSATFLQRKIWFRSFGGRGCNYVKMVMPRTPTACGINGNDRCRCRAVIRWQPYNVYDSIAGFVRWENRRPAACGRKKNMVCTMEQRKPTAYFWRAYKNYSATFGEFYITLPNYRSTIIGRTFLYKSDCLTLMASPSGIFLKDSRISYSNILAFSKEQNGEIWIDLTKYWRCAGSYFR